MGPVLRRLNLVVGCFTGVEHKPRDREVLGSNPAGYWAFSFLYLISSLSIRSLGLCNTADVP